MSAINNGGPAFPWCGDLNDCPTINFGMSLRDYFAANASEADVLHQAEIIRESHGIGVLPDDWRSTARYMHADSMLAASQKG